MCRSWVGGMSCTVSFSHTHTHTHTHTHAYVHANIQMYIHTYICRLLFQTNFQSVSYISNRHSFLRFFCFYSDCFVYVNGNDRLNYCVGGEVQTLHHLDRRMYLLGYMPKENRLFLIDKEFNVVSYELLLSVSPSPPLARSLARSRALSHSLSPSLSLSLPPSCACALYLQVDILDYLHDIRSASFDTICWVTTGARVQDMRGSQGL
jgi:hypothetical protein